MSRSLAKRVYACGGLSALILAGATAVQAGTTHYFYDPLGRAIGITADNQEQIQSYNYDAADNRSSFQMTQPGAPATNQEMIHDQYLFRDQSLVSSDGRFVLSLQSDGNLVLYGPTGSLWSSNTYLSQASWLVMQGDGNLVLYDPQWNILWNTGTDGHPGSVFVIQTDGNLVVYAPDGSSPWNSGTYGH